MNTMLSTCTKDVERKYTCMRKERRQVQTHHCSNQGFLPVRLVTKTLFIVVKSCIQVAHWVSCAETGSYEVCGRNRLTDHEKQKGDHT